MTWLLLVILGNKHHHSPQVYTILWAFCWNLLDVIYSSLVLHCTALLHLLRHDLNCGMAVFFYNRTMSLLGALKIVRLEIYCSSARAPSNWPFVWKEEQFILGEWTTPNQYSLKRIHIAACTLCLLHGGVGYLLTFGDYVIDDFWFSQTPSLALNWIAMHHRGIKTDSAILCFKVLKLKNALFFLFNLTSWFNNKISIRCLHWQ